MIVRRTFEALAVAVVIAAIPGTASAGSPPAASFYTKQQLDTMSQSWAAKAAVSSPTPEGNALLARIVAANAGDSGRPAGSYYTKQQLETMSQSWAARAALSSVSNAEAALASLSPETRDALVARLRHTTVVTGSQSTFEWGDFGIGAAGMLGLVLLAGGAFLAVRFGRRAGRVPAQRPV